MITSQDIANKKFERAGFGGYRNEDVDSFLNQVANTIDELEEQNRVLTKKLEVLAEKLEEYRSDEESLRAALLGAQKLGDSVIRESKTKAEIILRDANIKAERLINTAHDQVEKEKMVYLKMQKDVAAFKNKLLAIYKQHLELISSLPDDPTREKTRAKAAEEAQDAPAGEPEELPENGEEAARPLAKAQQPEAPADEPAPRREKRPAPIQEQADYDAEEEFEEPAQKPKKFIPVPQREPAPQEPPKKSPYADGYYEDFDEEEQAAAPKKKSKFGTLKFGAGYDLKRD